MKSVQVCSSRSARADSRGVTVQGSIFDELFHFNHCKIQVKKFDQSANKAYNMQTRHSHQFENCNSGKMFGKSW
jgi:hypothetical protein